MNGHTSDITIGDFWGIEEVMPDFYNRMGVSAVLINTSKGERAFERVKDKLEIREASFESIIIKNPNLFESSVPFVARDDFWDVYYKKGFGALIWKYGYINYYWQLRRFVKNALKTIGIWKK